MSTMQLSHCNSTFVYSNKPTVNFAYEKYVLIEQWIENCDRQLSEAQTLIKFDIDSLSEVTIQKAIMSLVVDRWEHCAAGESYPIQIAINQTNFDPTNVTWRTRPITTFYKIVRMDRHDLDCGCINLDITDLVQSWSNGTTPNYGITLSSDVIGLSVRLISCKEKCGPKLIVEYEKDECKPVALQVQVANRPLEIVEHEDPILFDSIVTSTPTGISYNQVTGEITISKVGYYLGQWWVAVGGAEAIPEINFALENVATGSLIESSAPVGIVSQPSGNAIFYVGTVLQTFKLINNSKSKIQFGTPTIQASLIIARI